MGQMPLVLAMNEESESGISYDDHTFVSYEYPLAYRNQIRPGERFVYYRGRRKSGGGRQPQVYLGTGVIGQIRRSKRDGRLVCEVLDGQRFDEPIYFKDEGGAPLEPEGRRRGYYQRGVRRIGEDVFAEILRRTQPEVTAAVEDPPARLGIAPHYADQAVARALERYSRPVVIELLKRQCSVRTVNEMPLNNPGFDLLTDVDRVRYVEVKATQSALPRFLLSEGERRFASEHADEFLLVVVYGVDLDGGSHLGEASWYGALSREIHLHPIQWAGLLGPARQV